MTDSYFVQGQELTSACFPDNYDPHTTAVYSPGLCPSAYTPVKMREGSSLSDTEVLTCCPTYAIFEARNTSQNNPFMSVDHGVPVFLRDIGRVERVRRHTRT
jgi:hypothetical protein